MGNVIQEERDINGLTITCRQLTPMRAYRLLSKIGKIAGPIARALTPSVLAQIKSGDYAAALPIAMSVFTELRDDEAEALALDVLRGTAVNVASEGGTPKLLQLENTERINAAFQGNLKAMLGAMMFALEINYKDFFSGRGKESPASETPTASP
jgi:hypothetical protein